MFQWLANQIRPFTTSDLIEELVPGYGARRARRVEEHAQGDRQRRNEKEARARLERERKLTDPFWARTESRRKRELLEIELKDAEWILEYEKRLIALEKKTARQRSQAEQSGADTERLRKLEHHLTGLRQNLSLD